MRLAVVVVPPDARSDVRLEAVDWLRRVLLGFDFLVDTVVDEPVEGLARSLEEGFGSADTVLVHVGGELAGPGEFVVDGARVAHLGALSDAVAAHGATRVTFIVELLHRDPSDDVLVAAAHVAGIVDALRARERGFSVLAATRPIDANEDPLAFTRHVLDLAADASACAGPEDGLLSGTYERAVATPVSRAVAESFAYIPGVVDLLLASRHELVRAAEPAPPRADPAPPAGNSDVVATAAPRDDVEADEHAADMLAANGQETVAVARLEAIASRMPARASVYERLFDLHRCAGRTDAAYLAALALEAVDAADVHHQRVIDQYRTVGPIRARGTLDDRAWELLRATGSDDGLAAIFAAVGRAAAAARVDELAERRELISLDPSSRLDETSTVTIARTFHWAARMMAVPCPNLHAIAEVPGGMAAMPTREPSTALGPTVTSGRGAKELAFLAGRHLTYHRADYAVLLHYPTVADLRALVAAVMQLIVDDGATRPGLHRRLARHLRPDEHGTLARAVRSFGAGCGRAKLGAWIRSAELTAGRAGLLVCGDLASAVSVAACERRAVTGVTGDDRLADLVTFCVSRAHAELRARFVATAAESVRPPEPARAV